MSKREAKKLITNSNVIDKKRFFIYIYIFFFSLYRAKDYYENDKERLREQARNKYRNLSEEDKEKNREYGKNRYRNV